MSRRPVIIGAGPAGLSAAYALARAGLRPLVLEAENEVGGLAGSFDVGGFRVDYGPHRLHPAATSEVRELFSLALGESLLQRPRRGTLHIRGRRVPFPLSVFGLVNGLGIREAVRHLASALRGNLSVTKGDDFGAEVTRRLGRHALRVLYGPAGRKVWGLRPEELDAALGRARVQKRSLLSLVRACLRRGARSYFYPSAGMGGLCESMALLVEQHGGEVRCGAAVDGMELRGGRVVSVHTSQGQIEPTDVVVTAPLSSTLGWLGRGDSCGALRYRALVLVYVALPQPSASECDVHYFADDSIPVSRCFEARNFLGAPPRESTVVGFDLPCAVDDDRWCASNERLQELIAPALRQMGVRARAEVVAVRRFARAYPVYHRGFRAERGRALDAFGDVEGLYPVGRHALFVHDNIHHACAGGLAAATAVIERRSARAWRSAVETLLDVQIQD